MNKNIFYIQVGQTHRGEISAQKVSLLYIYLKYILLWNTENECCSGLFNPDYVFLINCRYLMQETVGSLF